MCTHIFHAMNIPDIKQHFDTSVIYYPDRFPTSFNQPLLKNPLTQREPFFLSLCSVYVYLLQLHSLCLLTHIFQNVSFTCVCVFFFGGAAPQKHQKRTNK